LRSVKVLGARSALPQSSIRDAADAAVALEPLAGGAASTLFAVGLIGAAFLAGSLLPLSTAYSVCEYAGVEAAVDGRFSETRLFCVTFGLVTVGGAIAVLIPNAPLVTILVATQVLNAVLLVPLLIVMVNIGRDRDLISRFTIRLRGTIAHWTTTAVVVGCVAALAITAVTG
jgi:Mn2+/Fe2+ NRAMP family transporter